VGHVVGSDEEEDGSGPVHRTLEADPRRQGQALELPVALGHEIEDDGFEQSRLHETGCGRDGRGETAVAARPPDPEEAIEVHPGGLGRGRVEGVRRIDEGHEASTACDASEKAQSDARSP
jgi:hypothetical protein